MQIFLFEIIYKHNFLGLTDYVAPKIINYYNRGYIGFDSELILRKLSKNIDWSKIKNVELLSNVELFDESYLDCNYSINKRVVEESMIIRTNDI